MTPDQTDELLQTFRVLQIEAALIAVLLVLVTAVCLLVLRRIWKMKLP